MRKGPLIFAAAILVLLVYAVRSVFTLLTLLVDDGGARDAIQHAEIPLPNSAAPLDGRPQLIPKIIHQTWVNTSIPTHWRAPQQSCLDLHQDYEYKLWTDAKSREFIKTEYPWFLDTFDGYPHPIQRSDAIRYFVLAKYGGVYIDLDDGCNRRLDPLLSYPAWVRRTVPTGISNDVMGAVPQHPFFLRVIDSLQKYDRSWFLPYITIMYSTGPLFLSVVWKEYTRDTAAAALPDMQPAAPAVMALGEESLLQYRQQYYRVRILTPHHYARHAISFFKEFPGSSWHGSDAQLIFWMGRHWMFLTALGFMVAGATGLCVWWLWHRVPHMVAHGVFFMLPRRWRPATPPGTPSLASSTLSSSPWRLGGSARKEGYELVSPSEREHYP